MKSAFRILSTDCYAVRSISCTDTSAAITYGMSDGWIYSRYEFVARFISTVWSEWHILYSNRITDSDFRPFALQCIVKLTRETCSQRCILHCEEWNGIRTESSMMHGSFPPSHRCALAYCQSPLPLRGVPFLRTFVAIFRPCNRDICHGRGKLHCCTFWDSGTVNDLKTMSLRFIKFLKRLSINMKCVSCTYRIITEKIFIFDFL